MFMTLVNLSHKLPIYDASHLYGLLDTDPQIHSNVTLSCLCWRVFQNPLKICHSCPHILMTPPFFFFLVTHTNYMIMCKTKFYKFFNFFKKFNN